MMKFAFTNIINKELSDSKYWNIQTQLQSVIYYFNVIIIFQKLL